MLFFFADSWPVPCSILPFPSICTPGGCQLPCWRANWHQSSISVFRPLNFRPCSSLALAGLLPKGGLDEGVLCGEKGRCPSLMDRPAAGPGSPMNAKMLHLGSLFSCWTHLGRFPYAKGRQYGWMSSSWGVLDPTLPAPVGKLAPGIP